MKIIQKPSPNFSERKANSKINCIILHYTGMDSTESALDRMCDKTAEVSAHYCVGEDGKIYQLVEESSKAWHAGISSWKSYDNLNENSIGIEIVNKGHEHGYEQFSNSQIDSLIQLIQDIKIRNIDILQTNIVGHSDIAPDRKEDPGENFPWKKLQLNGIGIYHSIDYNNQFHYREPYISPDEESKEIGEIQRKLNIIGYKITKSTIFDKQTIDVITAFYRRFIPERISLSDNARYPNNIKWDAISEAILNDLHNQIISK